MLDDSQINSIVQAEEADAVSYLVEIGDKRATLMDYYNQKPFGDEQEGQSSVVTSDVQDTIEWMLPSLIRTFTQGKIIGLFESQLEEHEQEAKDKTAYSNWVFQRDNPGVMILNSMIKDCLLQFTGTVKVYWDDSEDVSFSEYHGLSKLEAQKLSLDQNIEVVDFEEDEDGLFNLEVKTTNSSGRIRIDNIPPEEFVFSRNARDFINPRFIGQRTPKTRSELIEMGFDKKIVNDLPMDNTERMSQEVSARNEDLGNNVIDNPTTQRANDTIFLGEYYVQIDVDEDGITELWQVFSAGDKILQKEKVDTHPYAVAVPIPIPHRALGTCPAEQVADIQWTKSTMLRQAFDNIYQSNYPRTVVNERVELDDLLTPRAAGIINVEGEGPISDSIQPFVVPPISGEIFGAIEYLDSAREIRTGVTRFNQGMDPESLNKTATGFKGIMDASAQRTELIARMIAETGIKPLFNKIIENISRYQDDKTEIRVLGKPMEINPSSWRRKMDCRVDVGLGSGDRQEKIANLNFILSQQKEFMATGNPLADNQKAFNTLDKLITEVGLKDISEYFNDTTKPDEVLLAQNEQLMGMVEQLQAQSQQNPLAEAEQVKAQATMAKVQNDNQVKLLQMQIDAQEFQAEMKQKNADLVAQLELAYKTLEVENKVDIPRQGQE